MEMAWFLESETMIQRHNNMKGRLWGGLGTERSWGF